MWSNIWHHKLVSITGTMEECDFSLTHCFFVLFPFFFFFFPESDPAETTAQSSVVFLQRPPLKLHQHLKEELLRALWELDLWIIKCSKSVETWSSRLTLSSAEFPAHDWKALFKWYKILHICPNETFWRGNDQPTPQSKENSDCRQTSDCHPV